MTAVERVALLDEEGSGAAGRAPAASMWGFVLLGMTVGMRGESVLRRLGVGGSFGSIYFPALS